MTDERHTARPGQSPLHNFHRDVFGARVRNSLTQETHVVVGDHEPERKLHRHVKFVPIKPYTFIDHDWRDDA
jgi:hypothetical protein